MNPFRLGRLHAAMQQAGADALIASSVENVYYATGFYSRSKKMVASVKVFALIAPDTQDVWLALPVCDLPTAREAGVDMARVIPYGTFYFAYAADQTGFSADIETAAAKSVPDAAQALAKLIASAAPKAKKVALDYAGLDGDFLITVLRMLPRYEFSNGLPQFQYARMVKEESETAALERAAQIAEDAVQATFQKLYAGISEREAAALYTQEITAHGAEPTFAVFTFGKRAAFVDTSNSAVNRLHCGDMIRADVGCGVEGYQADMSRSAALQKADPYMLQVYNAMREGQLAAIEAAAPGMPFSELYSLAMDKAHACGAPQYKRTHCGHSLGLNISEPPNIRPDCASLLEENMVLCVETPYYEIGWGGVQVEDTILITKQGCRLLTKTDSQFVII
ncbi:MAG: Xaa-Pro peptidase family protein [Clostridia bacterium]|nr:Xaa-Pro peptidase family protein [Clostridia bacterium]